MNGARRAARAACFAMMALLASSVASAQSLYRWNDAQGKVHYGDRPPKDAVNITRIDTGPEMNAPAAPAAPLPAPRAVAPVVTEVPPKIAAPDRNTQRRDTRERLRAALDRALENLELAKKKLADGGDMQEEDRQTVQQRAGRPPVTPTARQNCRPVPDKNGKPVLMCPVSVPTEQYYDRVAKLEDAVRKAEEEVAAAESAYRRGVD